MVVNLCQVNLFHLWLLYIIYMVLAADPFIHPVLASAWQGTGTKSLRMEILLELLRVVESIYSRMSMQIQNVDGLSPGNAKHSY